MLSPYCQPHVLSVFINEHNNAFDNYFQIGAVQKEAQNTFKMLVALLFRVLQL